MKNNLRAICWAFLAAVFYAINTPVSKLLLEQIPPGLMAGFLYLGAGVGVGILYLPRLKQEPRAERLTRADLPYTVGMIVLDIFAPLLLMLGVRLGSASGASLLGNFEIVATALIALLVFHERVTKQLWTAILLITLASLILSVEGGSGTGLSRGSLFVLLATVCWGLENNCTRKISQRSTYQIVVLKGIFSGSGALVIAVLTGERLPAAGPILAAMLLGFVAYGLSIFLYIRAQRTLGAAKTSAYYAAAPFVGAFLSFLILGESITVGYLLGLAFMVAGTGFVIWDTMVRHHAHAHEHVIVHTHNGVTHTHVVTHSHGHNHFAQEGIHGHRHNEYTLLSQHHHH